MKIALIGTLACLALSLPAVAADDGGGPPIIATKGRVAPTLKTNPLTGTLRLGDQQIFLETTRLRNLAGRTGADIHHRSGPGEPTSWICLADTDMKIWLSSDDGEGDDTITGVTVARLPGVTADISCPTIPHGWRGAILPRGLKIGMSDDALRAQLGAPSYDQKGLIGYVFTGPVARHGNGGVMGAAVWTAVTDGKVGLISLTQRTD